MYNESMGERNAVVALFGPRAVGTNATTVYTGPVDMSKYRRALVIGACMGSGTAAEKGMKVALLDCDASGTAAGTAFYTSSVVRVAGTAGEQSVIVVECKSEDLGQYGASLNAPGRYFKAAFTNSTKLDRSPVSVIVLGSDARYGPASDNDMAAVKAIEQA